MYNLYITELQSYLPQLINSAVRKWLLDGIGENEIPDKIQKLEDDLKGMGREQWIAIFRYYVVESNKQRVG